MMLGCDKHPATDGIILIHGPVRQGQLIQLRRFRMQIHSLHCLIRDKSDGPERDFALSQIQLFTPRAVYGNYCRFQMEIQFSYSYIFVVCSFIQ